MKAKSFADMRCSIAQSLEQVGPWWSLLIIRDAMMGAKRFGQFQRTLGIAKQTLSARLNHLVETGIMERRPAVDGSHHDDYVLTEKGQDLAPVLIALAQWGDHWAEHSEGRTFAFTEYDSGAEIERLRPRRSDGSEIALAELQLKQMPKRKAL